MKRGVFITIEGGEGAGKSTLIARLTESLSARGISPLLTREPGGTPLGEEVRKLLLHSQQTLGPRAELALFLASRAQQVESRIRPALAEGRWVLSDRFNDSTIVYQGFARSLGIKEVAFLCTFFAGALEPDLTLYLDIDPELGKKRMAGRQMRDRIEAEEMAFHYKIREGYLLLCRENPERIHSLDASVSEEELCERAMEVIGGKFCNSSKTL
ncbi:MAG: dTMP kinase [Verrucomicrobiota bacterium]|nr:dTMP kinase [Verrucomicrobiota bacterium]